MDSHAWHNQTQAGEDFPRVVAKAPTKVLLAFDFDGTLAPILPDPEAVAMVPQSDVALGRLGEAGAQIAVISGRPVDSLVRLGKFTKQPGLGRAVLLGQYGTERLDLSTGERRDPPVPEGIHDAKRELAELLARWPGTFLEDKGRAIVAHTRRCPDPEGTLATIEEPVRQLAARHGLFVEPGRLVWELRYATTTKGDALRELIDEFAPDAVLMAGDDRADIEAFEALQTLGELSSCVVVSASSEQQELTRFADVLCEGPQGVASWLTELADIVG